MGYPGTQHGFLGHTRVHAIPGNQVGRPRRVCAPRRAPVTSKKQAKKQPNCCRCTTTRKKTGDSYRARVKNVLRVAQVCNTPAARVAEIGISKRKMFVSATAVVAAQRSLFSLAHTLVPDMVVSVIPGYVHGYQTWISRYMVDAIAMSNIVILCNLPVRYEKKLPIKKRRQHGSQLTMWAAGQG